MFSHYFPHILQHFKGTSRGIPSLIHLCQTHRDFQLHRRPRLRRRAASRGDVTSGGPRNRQWLAPVGLMEYLHLYMAYIYIYYTYIYIHTYYPLVIQHSY